MANGVDTAALDRLLAGAQAVHVQELPHGTPAVITDPGAVQQLRAALQISGLSDMDWMSADDVRLEILDGAGASLASVGFALDDLLRWPGWDGDAVLADPARLLGWLATHGITNPLQQQQQSQQQGQQHQQARQRWEEAIPPPIAQALPGASTSTGPIRQDALAQLVSALRTAYPGGVARILRLLSWNGAGSGLASGYPSYEEAPAQLLAAEPAAELVQAMEYAKDAAAAGAARYLGSWAVRDQAAGLIAALSPASRARLRDAARDDATRRTLDAYLTRL